MLHCWGKALSSSAVMTYSFTTAHVFKEKGNWLLFPQGNSFVFYFKEKVQDFRLYPKCKVRKDLNWSDEVVYCHQMEQNVGLFSMPEYFQYRVRSCASLLLQSAELIYPCQKEVWESNDVLFPSFPILQFKHIPGSSCWLLWIFFLKG